MVAQDEDQSTSVYVDYNWVQANGGWIHSNNVLFYFAQSPFFDRTSANQTIITQNSGIPEREEIVLATRQRFEAALELITGVQYVVVHDPLESKTIVKGPNGPEQSDVWVIRKQNRYEKGTKDQNVHMLGFYYIVRQVIYEAPSLGNVLSYRMLNTTLSLDKIFGTASSLSLFSASHGHTYVRPEQRSLPSTSTSVTAPAIQQNRDDTPAPETAGPGTSKDRDHKAAEATSSDARVLREALQMTTRFRKEYSDDVPLIGEPGSFRYARARETAHSAIPTSKPVDAALKSVPTSKVGTPAPAPPSQLSSTPSIRTDIPPDQIKKASAKTPVSANPNKPKRRKSRIANDTE